MNLLKALLSLFRRSPPPPAISVAPPPVEALPIPSPAAPVVIAPPVDIPEEPVGGESDYKTRRTKLTPSLIAAIGAACAVAAPLTQKWEGKRNSAYYDPAKIATICWGHTGPDVRMGMTWDDGKCHLVFTKDQEKLGIEAARCTPAVVIRNPQIMGSVVDFAFNGGPALYCKSSMMRNFWTGDYAAGCQAYMLYIYQIDRRFNPPKKLILKGFYDPAKGTGRRVDERDMCLKGVPDVRH